MERGSAGVPGGPLTDVATKAGTTVSFWSGSLLQGPQHHLACTAGWGETGIGYGSGSGA